MFTAYHPALHGGPLWDDFSHITVPELRSFNGLWRVWTEIGATQQYYPLLHSAFWLEHRLWGDAFLGYHIANVVFHSASAVLFVLILRTLGVPGASLAGVIFALHPVAVESVAWISEQKNTLSAMFYLASAYVFLRNPRNPRDPRDLRDPRYWVAFALFLCALLTKTVTATLPAALLLVVWWRDGRLDRRRDVQPLVPWFILSAIAALFTAWFERSIIGAMGEDFALTVMQRVLLAGRVVWFYLGKLFWPQNLMFVYPRWDIDVSVWWQYVFPVAAIALAGALAVLARRSYRGPLAGYLYFCGTLVPALGFFDVYPFRFSYVADHFQYLASLGVIAAAVGVAAVGAERLTVGLRKVATVMGGAVIVALAVMTWNRSAVYRDAETLYRDSVTRNPNAWMAYQNLGTELAARSRFAEAIDAYEGALRAKPDYTAAKDNLVLAHMKLADAAAESPDRADEAIAHYLAVLRLDPEHFRAHYNVGTLLMDQPGREAESLQQLESALRIQPDSVEAHVNIGVLLADVPSRSREAIAHLEFALAKRPDLAPVREILERVRAKSQ